jgi:competence protein ComEC
MAPPLDGLYPRRANIVWRAPLVPVALAATLGILCDRFAEVPLAFSLVVAAASLAAWQIYCRGPSQRLAAFYLCCACAGCGAAYHHF